ncbi:monocarboxylate transporter 9 isoform X2 [Drosophila simulans]|uniref:Uncharacterized protein, isoform D n=1 Tax=Drosophila simulans TaxID=7240 RepID=A0A0J9RCP4_DROSI|nr:monocarboxylate transporter 9 isoform X2 [Drosophila simulans]KMY93818.1 uncharacterized protein Dsimw501_GD11069, isoform D [Drosophila simulans]
MSRNRRRSFPSSRNEDKTAAAQPSGSSLRSQSLSRLDISVQNSSIYYNDTRNTRPQMVSVAVGTDSADILNGRTSFLSHSRSQGSEVEFPSFYESFNPTFLPKLPIRRYPHMLVGASKEPETSKNQPATPQPRPIEPISEVPFVEPAFERKYSRTRGLSKDNEYEYVESTDEESRRLSFTSYTDEYDRAEPLITKTQKFYKKRAPLIPKYDSEDSYVVLKENNQKESGLSFNVTTVQLSDTASPESFSEYDGNWTRKQSWDMESRNSKESFDFSRGGRRLGSGMVFIYMVIPPDGGFGWVIMVLSFLAQLIVDGIIFTIGVLLPSIAQDLDVSISSVSFVASVQIGCYFTSGAFSAVLINRFGFRKVAIAGVLCSATTILASSWSVSLTMLIFFYSVLACAGGITLSMIWASSQLIVGYYFERYRPMANGFSCSGGGAGIVLFTFLNSWLVPIIGWRNMLRTQAGLIMLILLMVVAYVEVAPTQVGLYHLPGSSETSSDEYYGNFYVHDYLRQSALTAGSKSILSTYEPPPKKKGCAKFCPSSNCCWRRRKKSENDEEQNLLIRPAPLEREDLFYTGPAEYEKPRSTENLDGKEFHLMGSDKNTQQVNYGIKNIHLDDESDRVSRVHKERRWSNEHTKKQNSCRNSRFMLTLLKLFDYRLLKQFEFKILVASAFLFPMGFNIPFVYSSARTTIPIEYARMIGPIIGITNLVMRNILGILAYKRRTWTLGLCGCGLVFGGVSVLISAFYGENLIWFQFLYGFSYAVAPAVYSTLRGLIYVKYLGLSKLTNAFGITSLAMGMGAFIGTTIAGKLIGITGNYSAAFCFAGLCLIMSGCLKLLLPALIKCRNRMAK